MIVAGFRFVSEREPGKWYCCANSSAAMVAYWQTRTTPASLDAAHEIKRAAPRKHDGGMTQGDVRRGLQKAYGVTPRASVGPSESAIATALGSGRALIAQLTYGLLPPLLRRWSPLYTAGHSGVLCGLRDGLWGWFDPLAPKDWTGEWIAPSDILPALWTSSMDAFGEVDMPITAGDTINYGWESWQLDGTTPVFCIGGPRLANGSTDPELRFCANGPANGTDPLILTAVSRDRLTNGFPVAESGDLWAALTSGNMPDEYVPAGTLFVRRDTPP